MKKSSQTAQQTPLLPDSSFLGMPTLSRAHAEMTRMEALANLGCQIADAILAQEHDGMNRHSFILQSAIKFMRDAGIDHPAATAITDENRGSA